MGSMIWKARAGFSTGAGYSSPLPPRRLGTQDELAGLLEAGQAGGKVMIDSGVTSTVPNRWVWTCMALPPRLIVNRGIHQVGMPR